MCCVRNPRNINVFVRVPGREESGSRPGGSVTGVTEKLFMCQMFMCLFRPLLLWQVHRVFVHGPSFWWLSCVLTAGLSTSASLAQGKLEQSIRRKGRSLGALRADEGRGRWDSWQENQPQRLPKGTWNDNSHKATQNFMQLKRRLSSLWLVVSWSLHFAVVTRFCRSRHFTAVGSQLS